VSKRIVGELGADIDGGWSDPNKEYRSRGKGEGRKGGWARRRGESGADLNSRSVKRLRRSERKSRWDWKLDRKRFGGLE